MNSIQQRVANSTVAKRAAYMQRIMPVIQKHLLNGQSIEAMSEYYGLRVAAIRTWCKLNQPKQTKLWA